MQNTPVNQTNPEQQPGLQNTAPGPALDPTAGESTEVLTGTQINGGGSAAASSRLRRLTTMAMFTAISVVLVYFIRFPAFLPFLEYDPADIPIYILTFAYGTGPGLLVAVAVSVLQGLTVSASSGPIGIIMHIVATGSFVLVAGPIYRHRRTTAGAAMALAAGAVTMTVMMVLWNILLSPIFMKVPRQAVIDLLIPAFIPFNLMKAGINAICTFVLYKPLRKTLLRD